ncbi:MAG: hypothetical protein PCFJNLEI_01641 [Verrucomicrobiae bacterium]|nr:hypothetical protein [Verrucomicrobiae bacterium]
MTMQIIDANCGIGPWGWRDAILPGDVPETLAILDYCGIDRALAYSNLAHTPASARTANAAITAAAADCDRLIPAFVLAPHPYDDSPQPADYVQAMRAAGAKAVWLRPKFQQHGTETWLVGGLLALCADCRLPLLVSAEEVPPDRVQQWCREFPALRLVVTNLGYRADVWLYPLLRQHPELRACLGHTYVPPGGVERWVRHFGAKRLLFGSGLPHYGPGGLVGMVMYCELAAADKALILAGNIEQLMTEVRW